MRISIVLAVIISSAFLFSSCAGSVFAQDDLVGSAIDPGGVEIGKSLIHPATPFYFLKTIRENVESLLNNSQEAKVIREVEFSYRRLREIRSLIDKNRHDLVPSALENYQKHIENAKNEAASSEELQLKIGEALARQIDVLQRVYDQVQNPKAKEAIFSTLQRSQDHTHELLQKLTSNYKKQLIQFSAPRLAFSCKFLTREASSSALSPEQKKNIRGEIELCQKNANDLLRNTLEDFNRRELQKKQMPLPTQKY